jgi:hypothetical protein
MLVRGWLHTSDAKPTSPNDVSIPKPTASSPIFVEYQEIEKGQPFYEHEFSEQDEQASLVGHYAPGISFHESSDWIFKKSPGQRVLFKVDIKTAGNVTQFVPSAWVTDDVCNIADEKSGAEKPPSDKKGKKPAE